MGVVDELIAIEDQQFNDHINAILSEHLINMSRARTPGRPALTPAAKRKRARKQIEKGDKQSAEEFAKLEEERALAYENSLKKHELNQMLKLFLEGADTFTSGTAELTMRLDRDGRMRAGYKFGIQEKTEASMVIDAEPLVALHHLINGMFAREVERS